MCQHHGNWDATKNNDQRHAAYDGHQHACAKGSRLYKAVARSEFQQAYSMTQFNFILHYWILKWMIQYYILEFDFEHEHTCITPWLHLWSFVTESGFHVRRTSYNPFFDKDIYLYWNIELLNQDIIQTDNFNLKVSIFYQYGLCMPIMLLRYRNGNGHIHL